MPSQVLQQALKDLEKSYINFFSGRAKFPKFKKKGCGDSFRYPQGFKIDEANPRIFLPKLGWVKYRKSRAILGVAKNITISHKAGHWFAAIQTEQEVELPKHKATSMVGVDVGIAKFVTLSTGEMILPKNSFKNKAKKLARYQRAMARKQKFSKNWQKAKPKITYKQAWRGGMVLEIAPQYTSQKCSCCGFVSKDNRQSQALFKCGACALN